MLDVGRHCVFVAAKGFGQSRNRYSNTRLQGILQLFGIWYLPRAGTTTSTNDFDGINSQNVFLLSSEGKS